MALDPEVVRRLENPHFWNDAERHRSDIRALLADWERRGEALRGLLGAVDDVLRGWEAHRQLAAGQTGMGANILTEQAGKYGSLWCWGRVRKSVDEARAALEGKP